MPSVQIKKLNKKSPGNKDAKTKLNSEEEQGPLFSVPPRAGTQQRHLRDAAGKMTKPNTFSWGEGAKQSNGGGNITQENGNDSWDNNQQFYARREIFGIYPPVTASGEGAVGLINHTNTRNVNQGGIGKDRGLVKEKGRMQHR